MRDLTAFTLGYAAQAGAYLFLLTPRYPTSDPELAEPYSELPEHPVRIVVDDDLERPRLTVLFRLFLAIPHFVWLAAVVDRRRSSPSSSRGSLALVLGRVPDRAPPLPRRVRPLRDAPVRVRLPDRAPLPGFTGRAGSYGIDVEIDPPTRQSRWKTLFRFFLAIPAFILASALGGVALVIAFLAWWYALVTGRMPEGMRNLGAACLRYSAQTYAYALLVTEPLSVRRARPARDREPAEREPCRRVPRRSSETPSESRLRRARRRGARVGAFLLYPTAVPDDLALPAVDVDAVFGADFVARREALRALLLRALGARAGRAPG